MAEETPNEKVSAGLAEVWTEGPGFVYIRPFRGCELEIDLSRYQFKSEREAAEFVVKLMDRAAWDNLILANLAPRKKGSES